MSASAFSNTFEHRGHNVDNRTSLPRPPIYEAELRARHERNLLAHALAHRLAATVSRWLGSLAHKGVQQMRRFANERCQRRAIRTLNKLDDRMLADLGLCRGDIENVVRYGPPWHGTKRTAA